MNNSRLVGALCACLITPLSGIANAVTTSYTDQTDFLAALFVPARTLKFDRAAAGVLAPLGSTVGGAILTNDLGGEDPFAMTSAATFTGTGNTDLFLDDDDDDVSMRFTAANVIGLFVITDETSAIKESIT